MAQNNLELMRTLDDSWNAQDWDEGFRRQADRTNQQEVSYRVLHCRTLEER